MEWFKKNVSDPNQESLTKTMLKGGFSPDTNQNKFIDKVK